CSRRWGCTWASTAARRWWVRPRSAQGRASAGPSPPPGRPRTSPRASPARPRPGRSSWARPPPSVSGASSCWRASASAPSRTSRSPFASSASSRRGCTRRSSDMRVGISSWADPALIEARTFYPRKSMTAEARLRFYASVFDVVEVNASYYAIPDVLTVARWAERTPPGFVFHAKAWSLMTGHHPRAQTLPADVQALLPRHPRATPRGEILADEVPPEGVEAAFRLFRAALGPLEAAGKLGYVLFQFAPWVHFEERWLEYLAGLPARLPGCFLAGDGRH